LADTAGENDEIGHGGSSGFEPPEGASLRRDPAKRGRARRHRSEARGKPPRNREWCGQAARPTRSRPSGVAGKSARRRL